MKKNISLKRKPKLYNELFPTTSYTKILKTLSKQRKSADFIDIVPRRLFFGGPQKIAITSSPNYYQKKQRFTMRKNQEEHGPDSCKFGEIIQKLYANEPNQTSPKPPPPHAPSHMASIFRGFSTW
jgi:hypothetical protein